MCRILLLLGKYNTDIIYKFLEQSIIPKFTPNINTGRDGDYHLDGFGFAFCKKKKWDIYKNKLVYNKDNHLKNIIPLLKSNILIGHIRAMCPKSDSYPSYENTHPFKYKNNVWCHNGCVSNFNKIKKDLILNISDNYLYKIKGSTDSEYLFYYFLTLLDTKEDSMLNNLINTTVGFFNKLKNYQESISANIIYGNDNYILISRFVNRKEEPASLYYNTDDNKFIISSEPLTKNYSIFPSHTAWIIDKKTLKVVIELNMST
jgi:glutamine amidotransferase